MFVINPEAWRCKGKVKTIADDIHGFFRGYPNLLYDIHVTRWCRDAVGFVRRYVSDVFLSDYNETVRVHAVGGGGTLYEVVNAVTGLPGTQVAAYPYGETNAFLRHFASAGGVSLSDFQDVRRQTLCDVKPVDLLACGNNVAVGSVLVGSLADTVVRAAERPVHQFSWDMMAWLHNQRTVLRMTEPSQNYEIRLEDTRLNGRYFSLLAANTSMLGGRLRPAPDARPDDGTLELYLLKFRPKQKLLGVFSEFMHGHYKRILDVVVHYSGQNLKLTSEKVMTLCLDGEKAYGSSVSISVMPGALDLVDPTTEVHGRFDASGRGGGV